MRDIDNRFEYGSGTEVNMGCGASIYDEFWYFGGDSSYKRRQASKKSELRHLNSNFQFIFLINIFAS